MKPFSQPSAWHLLDAIREHLDEDLRPKLVGKDAYDLRVAANLLEILKRELELGPAAAARAEQRLQALLHSDQGLEELNTALSERIRQRELGPDNADLLHHLRQTALDQLAIDNPGYSAYRRAVLNSSGSSV